VRANGVFNGDSPTPEAQAQRVRHNQQDNLDQRAYRSLTMPPFLTWLWLVSSSDKSIPAHRLAAENLFTIMQDIEHHLMQRSEVSYTHATENYL
jgi:hypothetical protein